LDLIKDTSSIKISRRKAFQKLMKDGVTLLNAIQDVYFCKEIEVA